MSRTEIIGWCLIVITPGIVLNLIIEHRKKLVEVVKSIAKLFKPKKAQKICAVIEIYDGKGKKISNTYKFDKVV